jgi:hypothetical protein
MADSRHRPIHDNRDSVLSMNDRDRFVSSHLTFLFVGKISQKADATRPGIARLGDNARTRYSVGSIFDR